MKNVSTSETRFPIGAGVHYPVSGSELIEKVDDLKGSIDVKVIGRIRAMFVPSISYEYSLKLLLCAYLPAAKHIVDEAIIFADPIMHRSHNVALHPARFWESPLGKIEVSHRVAQLTSSDDHSVDLIRSDIQPHEGEVSIELQIPLLQYLWDQSIRILPFMVGDCSPRLLFEQIGYKIQQDDLIIVASTLSRGLPADYASDIDKSTLQRILDLDVKYFETNPNVVSSPNSLSFLLEYAIRTDLKAVVVGTDCVKTSFDRDRTTGLASILFVEK